MTMLCRITDENVYNPWDDIDENGEQEMKSLEDVTLYDLMGDENYVWVGLNKGHGFAMEIEGHGSNEPYLREIGIHPAAMESLAHFCKRFLSFYEPIANEVGA